MGGHKVIFKIDTGAEVSAISEQVFRKVQGYRLIATSKILRGPASEPLEVVGLLKGVLSHKRCSVEQNILVIRGLKNCLLGLPAIQALKLLAKIDEVGIHYQQTILEAYPSLFRGLGNLGDPYEIRLKPEAKPFALCVPRRIAIPLREKVRAELKTMEEMGIISSVDEPTQWCSGMVVVPKANGSIRICVDLGRLNESVMREVYPLPSVDETLAQLAGAKVFSKLDANSGFWQIPLASASRLLTTFITPFGRFCFNKLPFGISSAPEHFQNRMCEILKDLSGILRQMDDVLVFGQNNEEHDVRLEAALHRIQAAGATLNKEKCVFSKESVM